MLAGPIRLAVDVGGTFTDLQILEEGSGRVFAYKTSTTPEDPSEGLIRGVRGASARFGFELDQVSALMHGTTIATNAVLEDRLARGALVTTRGFRDVLEIGRHVRSDVYAPVAERRRLLVERALRFEADERVHHDGSVERPLDEDGVRALAGRIRDAGAAAVAVCFLHAYANPAHERRAAAILREALGHGYVCASHAVSPEIREFERTSTTVLNALLMPVVKGYLEKLTARMAREGFVPALYLVQSNGGVTSPAVAAEEPVRLLLSGPSGGALAAETLGARLGEPELVAIDMGGTSFDVSVVHRGRSRLVAEGAVDGCPVRLPMIEIRTIGAGGGSIAYADETGRLLVGPRSAGASPGPAAYARGGTEPTVTDANLVLGRIDPARFLGGEMTLDRRAARAAVDARVGAPLGLGAEAAAEGVLRVAVANMAAAIRLSLFEKGLDPKDFALVSFGGAGGLHAAEVAREVGARRVVYPRDAGTLSAWGMLFSDVVHDLARTRVVPASDESLGVIGPLAAELLAEGSERLARDGIDPAAREYALRADLRYAGQAWDIAVPFAATVPDALTLAAAVAAFHDAHEAMYAHCDREQVPEIVTLRLAATGRLPKPAAREAAPREVPAGGATRRCWLEGGWREAAVHDRDALGPGHSVRGPAIVEEPYATVVLPVGWRLGVAPTGDLIAEWRGDDDARD